MVGMSVLELGRSSVEDLRAYRERTDDMRVQLIEGELIVSPSPRLQHQVMAFELAVVLRDAVTVGHRVVMAPMDLRLWSDTVMQPDVLVVRRDPEADTEILEVPLLVVEVLSPTNRRTDLVRKPALLAQAGCPHFWVADPERAMITALELDGTTYRESGTASGEEVLTLERPFPVRLCPAELLR